MSRPALALLAGLLGVFSLGLGGPFLYDDAGFLEGNPLIVGPWPGWTAFLTHTFSAQEEFEPLPMLLHRALLALPGTGPLACRLASLLLHWACALLLHRLCRKAGAPPKAAAAATLLFALYPGHAEILAVATFKKHLLVSAAALAVAALAAETLTRPRVLLGWLALAAGLLSKESALVIPAVAWLADRTAAPPRARLRTAFHAGLWTLAAAYAAVRLFWLPRRFPGLIDGSWAVHGLASAKAMLWSLSQFPVPWSVCLEHTLRPPSPARAAAIIAALAALAFAARRLAGWTRFGAALAALALLPFINLVPFANHALVANRYLHLASAGFFLAAAASPIGRALPALALPAAAAYAVYDLRLMSAFASPAALWERTASCAPESPRAHAALGLSLLAQRRYPEAEAAFERSASLGPSYGPARLGLAEARARAGRHAEAEALIRAEIASWPSVDAYAQLGGLLIDAGRPREAEVPLSVALRFAPRHGPSRLRLGLARLRAGELDRAEDALILAAEIPSVRAPAFNYLAELHARRGDAARAAEIYERSLELSPLQADAALNLARLFARGDRARAAAVLDGFLSRLEPAIERARRGGRPEDRAMVEDAERQRERALELRSRLASPGN